MSSSIDCFFTSSSRISYRDLSQIYLAKRIIYRSRSIIIIYFLPFLFINHREKSINDCF